MSVYYALESFKINKEIFFDMKRFVGYIGNERMLKEYKFLLEFLSERGQRDISRYRGKSYLQIWRQLVVTFF